MIVQAIGTSDIPQLDSDSGVSDHQVLQMKVDPNGCLVMSSEEVVDIPELTCTEVVEESKRTLCFVLFTEAMRSYLLMMDVLPVAGSPKTRTFTTKFTLQNRSCNF